MATHSGDEGIVKVGSNVVAEVRSFSLTKTSDTREDTVMGDTHRTFLPGKKAWSAALEVFWDETDTNGQVALVEGASVTIDLGPEGDASGDAHFVGTGIVTEVSINSDQEGMVEASISIQGSGALDETPVV